MLQYVDVSASDDCIDDAIGLGVSRGLFRARRKVRVDSSHPSATIRLMGFNRRKLEGEQRARALAASGPIDRYGEIRQFSVWGDGVAEVRRWPGQVSATQEDDRGHLQSQS